MSVQQEVVAILAAILNLGDRAARLETSTPLLGGIPELDSMAVVSIITTLEERFGIVIEDDEVDGSVFTTVGSLVRFIEQKTLG